MIVSCIDGRLEITFHTNAFIIKTCEAKHVPVYGQKTTTISHRTALKVCAMVINLLLWPDSISQTNAVAFCMRR